MLLAGIALLSVAGCRDAAVAGAGEPSGRTPTASAPASSPLPAFPGAEGFGAMTPGGRGGRVIKVRNLDAEGPGSLQAACETKGPRIVVFDVSGVIRGDVTITEPYITIAGQTAPGAGITIEGMLRSDLREWDRDLTTRPNVHDVVVRFLRVRARPGRGATGDCVQFSSVDQAVLDHLSLSWAEDETIDLYARATNITVQWCTLEESSLTDEPGGGDYYGLIAGARSNRISIHHNLFAHHRARNPCVGSGPADFRNNVVYNFRDGLVHHGNYRDPGFNIISNYYKSGPSTVGEWPQDPYIYPWCFEGEIPYYLSGNYIAGVGIVEDPWAEGDRLPAWNSIYGQRGVKQDEPTPVPPVATHSPEHAYDLVLAGAGCFPRDVVTARTIEETRSGTGSWGRREPEDLMAGLRAHMPRVDSDDDGMPDAWENARGLDETRDDSAAVMASGYTALEEYINELADELAPAGEQSAPTSAEPRQGDLDEHD
jgi:pectate lyase